MTYTKGKLAFEEKLSTRRLSGSRIFLLKTVMYDKICIIHSMQVIIFHFIIFKFHFQQAPYPFHPFIYLKWFTN